MCSLAIQGWFCGHTSPPLNEKKKEKKTEQKQISSINQFKQSVQVKYFNNIVDYLTSDYDFHYSG